MNAEGKANRRVRHLGGIAEAVDGQAADWGHEDFDVSPGDEL